MSKLTTLSQLKSSLQSTKSYIDAADATLSGRIDAVVADIEEIVNVGGEANILEGVKVNGVALPITDKLVDLIIESGKENGTINVAGIDVAVKGLGALSFLNEISENELSDALKASIAAKATNADLSALEVRVATAEGEITTIKGRADALEAAVEALEGAGYQTAAQVETIAMAAVAASGHLKKEVVETLPAAGEADGNTLYLKMNAETGHYDIYGLVGSEVVLLDDTSVDLSQYSTTEQMNTAISAAIEALKIGDYAKLADLNAAVERIAAVEAKFNDYYTKSEMDTKLGEKMNVADMGTYATDDEVATKLGDYSTTEEMNAAIEAAKPAQATDEEVAAMNEEVFGSQG